MKKIFSILFTLTLSIIVLCSITGCEDKDIVNNNNGRIKASTTNYLIGREEEQADNGAQLISQKQINNILFLEYYIGQIKNCFVQNIMTPIFNDGSIKKLSYTENTVTSKTISEGIAKSISTTNSVSITDSETNTLSWKIGGNFSTTATESVGVNVGVVSAEASVSETFTISAEVGGSTETNHSETVSKSTTDSINNSYDITNFEEQCRSITTEYDMSDYENGYYYALV